jgi:pterin-4a-carbinolamine dehydratase
VTMTMSSLHRGLITEAHADLPDQHRVPIKARTPVAPVIPQDRWEMRKDSGDLTLITKTFRFARSNDRNEFIRDILRYEEEFEHRAVITIDEGNVTLALTTKGVGVTEVDNEFATYADETFKDVTFRVD